MPNLSVLSGNCSEPFGSGYIAAKLYLPDLRSECLPSIDVVVDSCALTHGVLPAFKAELQSMVEEC
jgi:hypothetical protein